MLQDYISPTPIFNNCQFARIFYVSRTTANRLFALLAQDDPFFQERIQLGTGQRSICPNVKFLCELKCIAYGMLPSAFLDYFQMGETTARECIKRVAFGISNNAYLRSKYLRSMTRSDARKASALHLATHGVAGMIGSMDCMHVGWKNCPVAWQGQYEGKEGKPTLVLEAFSDTNLFIWHQCFGWAGTLNDVNIWD